MKEYIVQVKLADDIGCLPLNGEVESGLFNADDVEDAKQQALMIWPGEVVGVFERVE